MSKIKKELNDEFIQLCRSLSDLGCKSVTVDYSGYGDSMNEFDVSDVPDGLKENVDNILSKILHHHAGGFENNEGGQGIITVNTVDKTYRINHQDNIVEVTESTYEG